MRKIDLIVIHCSATREDRSLTPDDLETQHRRRGFNGIGYHYYIRKDGRVHLTRPLERIGAHAKNFNMNSIGICYEGGLDGQGCPADTRTPAQRATLRLLVHQLQEKFPDSRVCGHRDLSPDLNGNGEIEPEEWIKTCPCFEVKAECFTTKNTKDTESFLEIIDISTTTERTQKFCGEKNGKEVRKLWQ